MPNYKSVLLKDGNLPQLTLLGQIVTRSEIEEEPQRVIVKSKRIPKQLAEEVRYILKRYFPELRGVLLYYTGSANGKYLYDWKIALDPELLKGPKRKLRHVIAHELTHLIQWQQDLIRYRALRTEYAYLYSQRIPKGEKACDIWVYARHPDLVAHSSYLLSFEHEFYEEYCNEIHELAKKAIEFRGQGLKAYIKWFEEGINKLHESSKIFYEYKEKIYILQR